MKKNTIPKWFTILGLIALLWNLMGMVNFFSQVNLTAEALSALPVAEQELMNNTPLWSLIAFGLAVFGGTIGCASMLLHKAWSKIAFLISLFAAIAQMGYWLFFTKAVSVYGPATYVMPVLVISISFMLLRLANIGIKKGYLN